MIEQTLYSVLSTLGIHLFPVTIPQERSLPAVTYFRLRTKPTNTITGGTNRIHDNADFQIDLFFEDYLAMAETYEDILEKMGDEFGANSLLIECRDEPGDLANGIYHRMIIFSLREIKEGGS